MSTSALLQRVNALVVQQSGDNVQLPRTVIEQLLTALNKPDNPETGTLEPADEVVGWYRHYKGGIYQVVAQVTHEADVRPMIVYRAANGTLWSRYTDVFFEDVIVDGVNQPRFKKISKHDA